MRKGVGVVSVRVSRPSWNERYWVDDEEILCFSGSNSKQQ